MTLAPVVLLPGLGSDEAVWRRPIERIADIAACQVGETRLDDSIAAIAKRVLVSSPRASRSPGFRWTAMSRWRLCGRHPVASTGLRC